MAAQGGNFGMRQQNPNFNQSGRGQPRPLMSNQFPRFGFTPGVGPRPRFPGNRGAFRGNFRANRPRGQMSRGGTGHGRARGTRGPFRGSPRGLAPRFSGIPPDYKFLGVHAELRFPNAKEKLHNIIQGAIKGQKLQYQYENVSGIFWKARLEITWPQVFNVVGEGFERRDAEKRAAAMACLKLEELGVTKAGGATAMLRKEEIGKEDEPKWIQINSNLLSRLESVLQTVGALAGSQQTGASFSGQPVSTNPTTLSSSLQTYGAYPGQVPSSSMWTQQIFNTASSSPAPTSSQEMYASHSAKTSQSQMGQAQPGSGSNIVDVFSGLPLLELSTNEQDQLSTVLLQEHKKLQFTNDAAVLKIREVTSKLPAASMRQQIVSLINANQVVVVSGETGCGKTTQIPQFILDDAVQNQKGASCNIVVTQVMERNLPRRIVAMSIAERVASERGEELGKSIGYQVRLEGKLPSKPGRILFCTTGILLRKMQTNTQLQGVSHVIVDEVHERDINTDFLIILLKELLVSAPNLKIIVMSATVDATRFCEYFNNCASVNIPGFTYPVTEYFLPDVQKMIGYSGNTSTQQTWLKGNEPTKRLKLLHYKEAGVDQDAPEADVALVAGVVMHIATTFPEGAILCFLAGWDEIMAVNDALTERTRNSSQFLVLPLHSMLPMVNQHAVFDRPQAGVRKIVLATNIAETSITIDDIVYVVNAGNLKEKTFDVERKISCLMTHWTSRASITQRRGRAGRTKPGYCFHLFSSERYQEMQEYQRPEMLRMSLEEIVLQAKLQRPDTKALMFLAKALDSPSDMTVHHAVTLLQEIGALDDQEKLTALGKHMANLPVDPKIAKMIIYGTIFRCVDPVLTIAASLGYKDPFVTPMNKREEADRVHRSFAAESRSDHVALLNAFEGWSHVMYKPAERDFINRNFLHRGTLNMISGMRDQFYRLLEQAWLIPYNDDGSITNAYSKNLELVKAIMCAGLFPNVIKVGLGLESKGKCGKKRLRLMLRTKSDGRVMMHPSSVNADIKEFNTKWLVYHEKVKSSQVYVRDSSMVPPIALLLFAGKTISVIEEDSNKSTLAIDDDRWMSFCCVPRLARALQTLRREVEHMVDQNMVMSKNSSRFQHHTYIIDIVAQLLHAPSQM